MKQHRRPRHLLALLVLVSLLAAQASSQGQGNAPGSRVKLVVLLVVDQFRYDFITRWRDQYTGGLDRLLRGGAVFSSANYEHSPTVTAVGHATLLTGATPAVSGIVGNVWYDRAAARQVSSVSDESVELVGGADGEGVSPRRLLTTTVGDELKLSTQGSSRVIGISLKDRGAVLTAGHSADAAYWFDDETGNFVSSTYYFPRLPDWVEAYNQQGPASKFAGKRWEIGADVKPIEMPQQTGSVLHKAVTNSAFGNELVVDFALRAVAEEKLGQRGVTDLLSISFSSNDLLGHTVGPDDPAIRALTLATDQAIGTLLSQIDRSVGLRDVLVVFTSDHGVVPLPEYLQARKVPAGRISSAELTAPIQQALERAYGSGKWILDMVGATAYLNHALIEEKKLDRAEVRRVAARAAAAAPHVLRTYTWNQLQTGQTNGDLFSQRIQRSFNAERSGDLEILLEPNWIRQSGGTTHGTPYSYDTHVPLILMGSGIKPGRYPGNVAMNDLAPTLATLLEIETPNGSVGRVLAEALQ